MKTKTLYILWGYLFLLCAGLGLLQPGNALMRIAMVVVSVIFFIPGGFLLYNAYQARDTKGILRIRYICLASLVLTTVALVIFLLCASSMNALANDIAYYALMVVSSPMFCSQCWVLSLFLWAVLLCATFIKRKAD